LVIFGFGVTGASLLIAVLLSFAAMGQT
jgi:hypothetical protein